MSAVWKVRSEVDSCRETLSKLSERMVEAENRMFRAEAEGDWREEEVQGLLLMRLEEEMFDTERALEDMEDHLADLTFDED